MVAELSDPPRKARHYRPVAATGAHLLARAHDSGRTELLDLIGFDPQKTTQAGGLMFDGQVHEHIDGVVALYYPDWLQFISNPFSRQNIDALCALFPRTLDPFDFSER